MTRLLRATARGLAYPARLARRRPFAAAAAGLALAALAAGWAYVRHQREAARAALAADRRQEALADYEKALEIDPDLLAARLRLAEARLEAHQPAQALPDLERLYRQAPDDPLVQARLGMCRFQRGEGEEARRLMEAAAARL